jgi:hypothetical protein
MNPETTKKQWEQNGQDEPSQISRLYDQTEQFVKTSVELYKLRAVKTGAGVFSSVATGVVLGVVFLMAIMFASGGLAFYLGKLLGAWHHGFFAVCGLYLIVGIIVYIFRNKFIRRGLSDYFVKEILED